MIFLLYMVCMEATASKLTNVKSTITTSTHIPALRMAVNLTGELFWVNSVYIDPESVYPVGYYTKKMEYHALGLEEARSEAYAHLKKSISRTGTAYTYNPPFLYPNIHMRLSKEIGDFLRFSFNAYNVLQYKTHLCC